jgi:hypothetical protein
MVVSDLNIVRVAISPSEADTPLVVDADAVLTGSISPEPLKAIAWRDAQVLQR